MCISFRESLQHIFTRWPSTRPLNIVRTITMSDHCPYYHDVYTKTTLETLSRDGHQLPIKENLGESEKRDTRTRSHAPLVNMSRKSGTATYLVGSNSQAESSLPSDNPHTSPSIYRSTNDQLDLPYPSCPSLCSNCIACISTTSLVLLAQANLYQPPSSSC